jgi:putative restriction endonuclease
MMETARSPSRWTPAELLAVFHFYCRTPFGKLHQRNPEVIDLARRLGRSPSAVAMKACNFASLDPALSQRGLGNASAADRALWAEFLRNPEALAVKAQKVAAEIFTDAGVRPEILEVSEGPTEILRTVRARRVQAFFRAAVLASYDYHCALTGLAVPELLNASHIIPWRMDVKRRADPRNGICLNVLHDRAFDRGLIMLNDELRVIVSETVNSDASNPFAAETFRTVNGRQLRMPERFAPDRSALAWHRDHVFRR